MSSFQIFTCCRVPTPWAARGLYRAEPTSTRAPGRPKTSFTSLPSEGPHTVRVSGESNPDLPIHSPASYLCATAASSRRLNYFSREYLTSQTNHLINPYHFISTLLNANFDFDVDVTIDIAKCALPGKVMQRSHCMEVRILTNENECYIMK